MIARAAKVRWSLLAGLVGLLAAGSAHAQTTCMFDTDCPGTECGTQVCQMSSGGGLCYDANTHGESGLTDGWCGSDVMKCKCRALGATCSLYCSFTIPPDAGAGGSGGGTGGGSGNAGATGTGGSGNGGSTGNAGTSGGGGGGGGCSIGAGPSLGCSALVVLLFAALGRRRSRRRA